MAKTSQKNNPSNTNSNPSTKTKRTRKAVPRDSPPQRSSMYRGVTRHRWTGRFEAHLWDKNSWNESQKKKGKQVYLGAYDGEEAAARAYDLAALKYWGQDAILNFPLSNYKEELIEMEGQSKEEYIGSLRRKSSGFSRGASKYRGVARHHHNGRWEARIGRVFGNKYLYLGTYATQEEAATAYDMAAIEYRGLNAVTNFDLSRYIKWLRPSNQTNPNNPNQNITNEVNTLTPKTQHGLGQSLMTHYESPSLPPLKTTGKTNGPGPSALGLPLQSSKFKEMVGRSSSNNVDNCPSTPPQSDPPRGSFPDYIQTYFDCQDSSGCFTESEDSIFGDLNSFAQPILCSEFDG